jgi:type II secretory pathway component GspD/PulD (secretin)
VAQAGGSSASRQGRPGVEPDSSPPEPVLKVYHCRPGEADSVAARLRGEFGTNPNVRVVSDRRTSQVLIMAPPDVQARIADRLPAEQASAAAGGSVMSPDPSPPPSPGTAGVNGPAPNIYRQLQLWHTTGEQFEAALVRMLADRLVLVPGAQPDASAYQLTLADGQSLRLTVDRRSNRLRIEGPAGALASAIPVLHVLDRPEEPAERSTRLVSLKAARRADVERVVAAIRSAQSLHGTRTGDASVRVLRNPMRLAMASQPTEPSAAASAPGVPAANGQQPAAPDQPSVGAPGAGEPLPGGELPEGLAEEGGLIGPVQVEILPGTDILVIRGHDRDVQKVVELIEEIEKISEIEKPVIEVRELVHVDCRSLATLLDQLYEEVFSVRQGDVSITALVRPNALLLIGRQESVDTVVDLVERLDRPVPPSAQFQVFRLKNTPAERAQESLTEFFEQEEDEEGGLGTRVQITADFRTNSLIVRANPRDMAEVAAVIERIDTPDSETFNEVRVFKLKNSLAEDLAPVLQDAITGQMYGQRTGQAAMIQRAFGGEGEQFERKSIRLQFVTTDEDGQRTMNSGLLNDVQVTADTRQNALIVTAAPDSMPLIAALIEELDQLPVAEAQVKVFTVVHGDATNLVDMLETLFGAAAQPTEPAVRTGATGEDSSLVSLRFAVDVRTNSIIATGSSGDLELVEAVLMRLDESDLRMRRTAVIRLNNASAATVAEAVNEFVSSEVEAEQPVEGLLSTIEQVDREVVVVPEEVTNSLIISATERFFDRIVELVEELDERPPMVLIQVLIAAVQLTDTDEFGIELGLQDSILFDRSVAGVPGFLFNNSPLGNNTDAAGSNIVGTQGLTNLGLGRTNSELGYGGLVISASSEAVSVLIRALKENRRLDVLGRPQIMTTHSLRARIFVGEIARIPSGTSTTEFGTVNLDTEQEEVGLLLEVIPRVTPDDQITMEILTRRRQLGPEEEGTVISISATGEAFRSPIIDTVEAETQVSVMDGQTVILGGLITKDRSEVHRRIPWLSDVPVLGHLFRFDSFREQKEELLIIMTPHIVESLEEAEVLKQVEIARMDWCLGDVLEVHGDPFGRMGQTPVIYPDLNPTGATILAPEDLPDDLPEDMPEPGPDAPAPEEASPFLVEPPPPEPALKGSTSHEAAPPEQAAPPERASRADPGPISSAAAFGPGSRFPAGPSATSAEQTGSHVVGTRRVPSTATRRVPPTATRRVPPTAGSAPGDVQQAAYQEPFVSFFQTDQHDDRREGYPENGYRRNGDPSMPASPSNVVGTRRVPSTDSQMHYPASGYRTTSYVQQPFTGGPDTGYPQSAWPAGSYPATGAATPHGPPPRYPTAQSRPADPPSPVDPAPAYPRSDPSLRTTSPPRDAWGYGPPSQPGVARFQGGIEVPTGTDVYQQGAAERW